jgi:hypothetical protein
MMDEMAGRVIWRLFRYNSSHATLDTSEANTENCKNADKHLLYNNCVLCASVNLALKCNFMQYIEILL